MIQDQGELPSGGGLVMERVKNMSRIVPMLDLPHREGIVIII